MTSGPAEHPLCPRCGYDVSGPVPDWKEECPLRGLCPECGQTFAWGEVFFPDRNDLPGFFEHARGGTGTLLLAAWRTWLWTLRPGAFFEKVRVTQRVVPARLALWLVVLVLPLHALAGVRQFLFPIVGYAGASPRGWEALAQCSAWTYPIASFAPGASGAPWPPRLVWHILATPSAIPAALVMHAMYAFLCVLLPSTLGAAKVRTAHVARAFVYGLAWMPLLSVFRIGRNLWLVYELGAGSSSIAALTGGGPMPFRLGYIPPVVLGTLLLGWTAVWWAAAFVRGWRIHQAWLVLTMLTIAGVLAAAGVEQWLALAWYW